MENAVKSFEPSIDHFIRIIGSGIEIFGVLVIVIGIVWSTYRQLRQPISEQDADAYKIRIGRSLLLGLEVLVAADIVKTIAHELSVMSLRVLGREEIASIKNMVRHRGRALRGNSATVRRRATNRRFE